MVYGYIYKIVNTITAKVYVGQTTQHPHKRKNNHFNALRNGTHWNPYLQNSFNKYGEGIFRFIVLNYATDKNTLDKLENEYIIKYNLLNDKYGYNLKQGGAHGKHSEESKIKISKNNGMYQPKARKKIIKARTGKRHSEETRKKIGRSNKGKKISKNHWKNLYYSKRKNGLFGFTGASLRKGRNVERKCWQGLFYYKGHKKSLGDFEDPLSAQIVHDFVLNTLF